MQYIRGDRECGILLWFLSQYCNFGCFQSKTPLDKSVSKRRFSKNTHKNKVSATSNLSWTMVTLVPTSTDPIGNE